MPLYFVIAASALAWLVPVLWAVPRRRPQPRPPREPRPAPLLFEKLLAAFIVLYALQALYSSPGFVKALQNEVFFYVPFAVLLARLRDLDWNRELLIRCLLVTVGSGRGVLADRLRARRRPGTCRSARSCSLPTQLHEYFTVNSVFFDPNIFGRYLALVMLLVATVLLYDRRTQVQLGSLVTLAILWTCLVFTLSRSSLVALALGLAVLAAFRWKTRPVLYLGVAAVIVGAIVIAVASEQVRVHRTSTTATSGRAQPDHQRHQAVRRPPAVRLGLGLVHNRVQAALPAGGGLRLRLPQHPGHGRRRAGHHRRARLPGAGRSRRCSRCSGARGRPVPRRHRRRVRRPAVHTMLYADFLEDPVTWTLLAVGGSLAVAARANATRSDASATCAPSPEPRCSDCCSSRAVGRASSSSISACWPSATRSTRSTSRAASADPRIVIREMLEADVVVGWWASWHTFLPITLAWLLRKPSLLIVGGFDTAAEPEFGYGFQLGGLRAWLSRFTMRRAADPDDQLRVLAPGDLAQHRDPAATRCGSSTTAYPS